jgi:hypothetical protein
MAYRFSPRTVLIGWSAEWKRFGTNITPQQSRGAVSRLPSASMSCTATQLPATLHFVRPSTCPHLTVELPFPGKPLSVFPIISVVPLLTPTPPPRPHTHIFASICTAEVTSALKLEAVCRYADGTPHAVVTRKESLPESLQTSIAGTTCSESL